MAFRKREYMSSASICNSKMQRSTWHPMGCKFHSNLLFKTSKKESLIPPILNPNPIPNPIPSSNLFVKSHHHHPHLPTPILYHHFCWNPIKITKWLKSSIPLPNPILNRGKGQNFCGRTGSVSSGSFPRVDFCGSRSGWFPIQLLQFFFFNTSQALFTKRQGLTRSCSAWRSTVSVCTAQPSMQSTTTMAPSVMRRAAVTSPR